MKKLKIILNIFYNPTDELKNIIEKNKDIYIPINGGSLLKDDEWCKLNLYFDNVGDDNISHKNKLLNEFTSIYWVYKNYDKIGNPDYIGFNHYRRLFNLDSIKDYENYDCIFVKPQRIINPPLENQYKRCHHIEDLNIFYNIINNVLNEDYKIKFETYMKKINILFAPYNMFIFRKDFFFNYCNIIFTKLLPELEKNININDRSNYQKRAICFLMERFFSFLACNLYLDKNVKCKMVNCERHLDFKPEDLSTENEKNPKYRNIKDKSIFYK